MPNWFTRRGRRRPQTPAPSPAVPPISSRAPAGTAVYAIGDIHGRLDLLRQLESLIERDAAAVDTDRRVIVCLGDYIDRGDDSFGVIEHFLQPPPSGFERICLIGNHESYLLRIFADETVAPAWLANGGRETLVSYGVDEPNGRDGDIDLTGLQSQLRDRVPDAHRAFLRALVPSHREGDYLFVHAGVRPGVPLDRQDPEDFMWIRQEFLADTGDFGAVVVHGHTISGQPENLPNRIGIDTGAYYTGRLTCAVLRDNERRFLST